MIKCSTSLAFLILFNKFNKTKALMQDPLCSAKRSAYQLPRGYSHFSSIIGSGPVFTVHAKNIWNFSTPKKYLKFKQNIVQYFDKPQNPAKTLLKFKNLNPQKMARAYVCRKISEYTRPPPRGINT